MKGKTNTGGNMEFGHSGEKLGHTESSRAFSDKLNEHYRRKGIGQEYSRNRPGRAAIIKRVVVSAFLVFLIITLFTKWEGEGKFDDLDEKFDNWIESTQVEEIIQTSDSVKESQSEVVVKEIVSDPPKSEPKPKLLKEFKGFFETGMGLEGELVTIEGKVIVYNLPSGDGTLAIKGRNDFIAPFDEKYRRSFQEGKTYTVTGIVEADEFCVFDCETYYTVRES